MLVTKASQDEVEVLITQMASRMQPRLAKLFLLAFQSLQGAINLDDILLAVQRGDPEAILRLLHVERWGRALQAQVTQTQASQMSGAIASLIDPAQFRFDQIEAVEISVGREGEVSPHTLQFAQRNSLGLVQDIKQGQRRMLRAILRDATLTGQNPRETARDIKRVIGLDDRLARAVVNFRRMLERGSREALSRNVGGNLSRSINAAIRDDTLTAAKINTMVENYRQRMLSYRANMIARTEAIRAANAGNLLLWQQLSRDGVVRPDDIVRKWLVANDERLCPICRGIAQRHKTGVGLNEPFTVVDEKGQQAGTVMHPPVHPHCRCTIFYRLKPGASFKETRRAA